MNLIIKQKENHFELTGFLTRQNLPRFQRRFQDIFQKHSEVKVNIEGLKSIDHFGVMALARLHNHALVQEKKFSIIGYGSKELYEEFEIEDVMVA